MISRKKHGKNAGYSPALAVVLSWIVPGAGHFYTGKKIKGVLFAVIVLGLFIAGLAVLPGGIVRPWKLAPGDGILMPLFLLAAELGNGIVFLFIFFSGGGTGRIDSPMYEMGTTYTLVSGFLGFLVILNAYETAIAGRE